ncbi:antibiotic biosynthesis monooxygenase [Ktedonobacteria bacterium brp13]|nr:antibiotic biosynthesis monooxygenase [Ktedonobacteria bacterium brp13]
MMQRNDNEVTEDKVTLPPVVLINVFEVPIEKGSAFVEWWKQSSEALKKEAGFIDAKLHRSLQPGARFQFINIAHWETAESLELARTKNQEVLQSLTPGRGTPALYEITAQY